MMNMYDNFLREALILSNSQLTNSDSPVYIGSQSNKAENVCANQTQSNQQTGIEVKDWEIRLTKSINDRTLLTDQQRDWIKYAYSENRSMLRTQDISNGLLIVFKSKFSTRKSTHEKLSTLFCIAIYCVAYENFTGKKTISKKDLAELLGISYESYRKYWNEKYEWATQYIKNLDESAIKTLSQKHQDENYMIQYH